jgi:plastocyanin
MSKNANFKIVNVIAALTLAVIVMSITYAMAAPETHLFAKKHKVSSSDSSSGSTDNDQTSSNDQSSASSGASETGNEVKIVGIKHSNSFDPNPIDVRVGDTVTWTNDHHVGHTVTSTSSDFNSGDIQPGQSFRHTFDKSGTFDYYCIIHPSMVGKVSVT